MNAAIVSVTAVEAYGDRGTTGIEVTVKTAGGAVGKALSVGGCSLSPYEYPTPRDPGLRFDGFGLSGAADAVNKLAAPALKGRDAADQRGCDEALLALGKERFGAIGLAAVSMAVLKAGAASRGLPLYRHLNRSGEFILPAPSCGAAMGSVRYGGPPSAGGAPTYSFVAYDFIKLRGGRLRALGDAHGMVEGDLPQAVHEARHRQRISRAVGDDPRRLCALGYDGRDDRARGL